MKTLAVISLFISLILSTGRALSQTNDEKSIKEVITAFAKAGDQNDANALNEYLDENYRVVMNRLFGSKEVSVLPKSIYLEKIRTKEFGGDDRKVKIKQITVNGNTASAQVTFIGKKLSFSSITVLVKNEDGQWKLVSETPIVL